MVWNNAHRRCSFTIVGLGLCLAFFATGCGGSNPKTIKVVGKVSYQGKPVTQGTVTFQPTKTAEGAPNRPATGVLSADGTYELSTFEAGDGAIPGEYTVLVVTITGGPTPEEPDIPETWATPEKFGSPVESPLNATVPADHSGVLEVDFDLDKSYDPVLTPQFERPT